MGLESALPLITGIIAIVISSVLLDMYVKKKKIHYPLWAAGMLLWAMSDITQFYALLAGWTVPIYLTYYFCSVMLAGFLGAGTLCLVFPKSRVSKLYIWFNVIAAVALFASLAVSPINAAALKQAVAGANGISGPSRYIAALVNIPALFTFAGGALYSFVRTRKIYALLITIGALIPALGGILAAVAIPQLLPFTDILGILFLGAGFYLSFRKRK